MLECCYVMRSSAVTSTTHIMQPKVSPESFWRTQETCKQGWRGNSLSYDKYVEIPFSGRVGLAKALLARGDPAEALHHLGKLHCCFVCMVLWSILYVML